MVTLAPVFLIRNVLLSVVTSRVLAAGDLDYVVSVSRTHRNVRIIVRNNKMPLSLFFSFSSHKDLPGCYLRQ